MDRRAFIVQGCSFCLAGSAAALGFLASSCAGIDVYEATNDKGLVTIPMTAMGPSDRLLVHPQGSVHEIGLVRSPGGEFHALLLRCTHAENPLVPTGTGYRCPAHGSAFDLAGNVTHGPAQKNLHELSLTVSGDHISIRVPEQ